MELKGAQDSFAFLKAAGLAIAVFISDRHRSIENGSGSKSHKLNTSLLFGMWPNQ